ncbi:UNVERIFIED_ORG: hypothetical protein FHR35_001603 [Microbispora rosea subsp. rosea]
MDDRVDWVAGLARVSGSAAVGPRDTPTGWRAETANMHVPRTGGAARFGSPEHANRYLRLADVLDEGEMLIDITIGMDVGNRSRW